MSWSLCFIRVFLCHTISQHLPLSISAVGWVTVFQKCSWAQLLVGEKFIGPKLCWPKLSHFLSLAIVVFEDVFLLLPKTLWRTPHFVLLPPKALSTPLHAPFPKMLSTISSQNSCSTNLNFQHPFGIFAPSLQVSPIPSPTFFMFPMAPNFGMLIFRIKGTLNFPISEIDDCVCPSLLQPLAEPPPVCATDNFCFCQKKHFTN